MNSGLDKIVVVGGGSAGWITALMTKERLPHSTVTVIESEEIGILGAGEGTTPLFINFLDYVKIPTSKIISEANGTFKNGLKFTNWNGDESHYYHNFSPIDNSVNTLLAYKTRENFLKFNQTYGLNILHDIPREEHDFVCFLNESNKVGKIHGLLNTDPNNNPIHDFYSISTYGLHFDASLLATTLKNIAISRGIVRLEGKVVQVNSTSNGDISGLVLESSQEVLADFVFDCSGLHRLLIGKHFNAEWDSFSDRLPNDSALPFFIDIDESIPPYTECIAMKYGWVWKIPLQNRYGCGYVFDSSFITEQEAAKEIEEWLGYEPRYPRKEKGAFKFKPGTYKTPWVNNCVAIGLSSGFVEPLEATALGVVMINLANLLSDPWKMVSRPQHALDKYNKNAHNLLTEIADFLVLHYITQRDDTEFWTRFTNSSPMSDKMRNLLSTMDTYIPDDVDFNKPWDAFNYGSFFEITFGTKNYNKDLLLDMIKFNDRYGDLSERFFEFRSYMREVADQCMDHNDLINYLKGS